jgi:hypothetical protein
MKILEFKRSGIGLIAELRGIPNGFPNQATTGSSQNAMSLLCVIAHVNLSTFTTGLEDARHCKERLSEVGLEVG